MNAKIKFKELLAMIPEKPKGKVPTEADMQVLENLRDLLVKSGSENILQV